MERISSFLIFTLLRNLANRYFVILQEVHLIYLEKKLANYVIGLISLITIVTLPSIGLPYILPSTQIIEFMTNKFGEIHTLKIIQHTKAKDLSEEEERVFGEIIYLKSPHLYRSEIVGQPGKRLIIHNRARTLRITNGSIIYDGESQGLLYRFLLLAQSPRRLSERLKLIGIDLEKVSLTRFEGRIAYLIGEKEEWSPRLLVDKDLFLPLLLRYDNVIVHFSDYREFREQTWYPFKIVYSFEDGIEEEYNVKDIIVNPPIDLSLFDIPRIRTQFGVSEYNSERPESEIRGPEQEIQENIE